ncbi:PROBABLE TETRONASIN-TRANSPORT INTEGRAL MEMBRANE PROTEIN ABC TRANSPORTER [Alloactinosynnema sp. L-07]|uniref:ABC transporter permease n=1 Tax=Alloactinosynnema sp. L-07 TaxID=1653480 RepID=UPI00065EF605|nr:ABC transporter permease [Alloactinosynnema sp. L-07]CRK60956.1 PROBABLE TETRONASIN-TRANSPORT INTEGRAL MEMBRANE PROTEIN ABC TRANSPORTER [Alloactinosynnema sp. L-07]
MTGTWPLIRLALRRDRIILPIWIVLLGLTPASTVAAYDQLYPDAASRVALSAGAGANPSIAVIYGPAYDLTTAGGFTAWRYGLFLALFAALMSVFTVTRHTRAEEDSGRLELIGSAVVGRYAALTAAVSVAAGANVVIGLAAALGLVGAGLPASGSFLLGLGVAGAGLVFTAISAVTAQLTEYARSANGIACAVLGGAFLVRAVGDSTASLSWVSWFSPLAWPQRAKPFVADNWWPLGLVVLVAGVILTVAYSLVPRRDLGAGLFPARLGPATAPASLSSPLGLAWRLQRGALIGWTVGAVIVAAVFGSIANGISDLVGTSDQVREIMERMGGARSLVDSFIAAIAQLIGIVTAMYAVQAALRARSEETAARAEPVLATGAGRVVWVGSHLAFAVIGSAVLLGGAGLAMGLAHGLRIGDLGQVGGIVAGTLAQLPAVWVAGGVAALLFGLLPQVTTVAWGAVALFALITLFGPAVQLSQSVLDISPFTHVPRIPGAEFTATPLLWLAGTAVVLFGAGVTAFRRRDVG